MISIDLFQRLLYEGEGDALDFKRDQYPFAGADDESKSELLKDILAFANSWRRSDAYVLIGAKEVRGQPAEVVGITDHIDDSRLQQFVNTKTQRPVQFGYFTLTVEGKEVAVLHVPLQERPLYLTRDYGKLTANTVYVRRGSSTAIATPDEIAKMGRNEPDEPAISLTVFFADPSTRQAAVPTIKSIVLKVPSRREIPDYDPEARSAYSNPMRFTNSRYLRELVEYTRIRHLVSPVWFAISNTSAKTAHDVRLEIRIGGAESGVHVMDENQYPSVPVREFDLTVRHSAVGSAEPEFTVAKLGSEWLISGRVEKVQPKATEWLLDPVYIGSDAGIELNCLTTIYSDSLRTPHEQVLVLPVASSAGAATLDEVVKLEAERYLNSPEARRFMAEQGLDQESE